MHRDVAACGKALDSTRDDLARNLLRVLDIRVMMVVGVVLRARQAGVLRRRDDGRLEAACHIHDGWVDILHIGAPEIERARAEHELCADGIRERDDALVAVHGGEAGAADAVELDALCAVCLRELDHLRRAADAHDLADERRQMAVHGDVDPALLERADVDLRRRAVAVAEEHVRADVRGDDAREAEGEAAAQELLHEALPVAVRADSRAVVRVKDLVVGAYGDDVELVPDILALLRRHHADGLVVIGDGAAQVLEQDVGEFARELAGRLALRLEAERLRDRAQFFLAEDWQLEAALCDELHREQDLAGMRAVLGDACGRAAQQVARHDDIGICTADAERALLCDLAWAHVAVLAADARQTERALRLLLVEAVKDRVATELTEVLDHLAHSRVRRLLEDVFLRGECLAIRCDSRHVVVDADFMMLARRVDMRAPVWMLARLQRAILMMVVVMTLLVVMLVMMIRVFLFRHIALLAPVFHTVHSLLTVNIYN